MHSNCFNNMNVTNIFMCDYAHCSTYFDSQGVLDAQWLKKHDRKLDISVFPAINNSDNIGPVWCNGRLSMPMSLKGKGSRLPIDCLKTSLCPDLHENIYATDGCRECLYKLGVTKIDQQELLQQTHNLNLLVQMISLNDNNQKYTEHSEG